MGSQQFEHKTSHASVLCQNHLVKVRLIKMLNPVEYLAAPSLHVETHSYTHQS